MFFIPTSLSVQLIIFIIFSYNCIWPKKLIISKADLAANSELKLFQNLSTTCESSGAYNIDMTTYACTRPCPLPKIPEPLLMTHNWTNATVNAEYLDVIE
jgi:hypothetical protein